MFVPPPWLRSSMDGEEFSPTRHSMADVPPISSHWVQKVEECIEAAKAAGDMVDGPIPISLEGWCVHHT